MDRELQFANARKSAKAMSRGVGGRWMMRVERRSILKAGAVTAAVLCWPGDLRAAGSPARVFVVDRRFAVSEAVARDRRRRGAQIVDPREEDLGISWRGRIPKWLDRHEAIVEGVTLWSDSIICGAFGRTFGLRLATPLRPVALTVDEGLHHWLLLRGGADRNT
jgi:hypothetical protein